VLKGDSLAFCQALYFKDWATHLEILDTAHDPKSIDVTAPDFEFTAASDE